MTFFLVEQTCALYNVWVFQGTSMNNILSIINVFDHCSKDMDRFSYD